jgi:hypothetical protein
LNECEVVGGEPIVARRHPTTLFDPVEEPLDLVGDVFSVSPSSENQTDGSLSSITFKRAGKGPARELTIEYLAGNGFGRFLRR